MVSADLLAYVREVAEELVRDLETAAARTRNWGDVKPARKAVKTAMDKCLDSLTVLNLWGKANQVPSSELWNVAGELLATGTLQTRARQKPRGYAGDDIMLTQIYERTVGGGALGRLFDEYFQQLDAPEAVRGRIDFSARAIVEAARKSEQAEFHLKSVGAGPAIDVQLALQQWPDAAPPADVTLLDLDQEALDRAQARLAPLLPNDRLRVARENLYRLPTQESKAALLAESDFLVCLGLFDYLDDRDAETMLRTFWQSLRPGGELLVGNFAPHTQSRGYMEWIGNWRLIYRDRDQFAHLAERAGIPRAAFRIEAEPQGVDLLLRAER
jgi:SAM-dependent methyltransferase